jgi:TonB family protein
MITYLLEVSFSWLFFYLVYALFLRQEHYFGLNRSYLLIALIGGLCLPFLQIETTNTYLTQLPILLDEITVGVDQNIIISEQNHNWNLLEILLVVYLIGLSIGFVRLYISLQKLYQLYKEGLKEDRKCYTLIKTNSLHSPFSFGRYLFISNNSSLNPKEYQYIIEHEITHIRQKHSLDLLLIEALSILFWFNPLVFLYRTALRDQHEFLADQAVLNHVPIKEYGQLLIEQSIPGLKIGLVNHLIYSQLKKRINMMTTKKQSNRVPYLRYALSFSAFLLVFWTVSCQKDLSAEAPKQLSETLSSEKKTDSAPINEEIFTVVEEMPTFPGCEDMAGDYEGQKACADQKLLQFIYKNIKYPEAAQKAGLEGMVVVRFVVTKNGNIKDISAVRSLSEECDAEVTRVVQLMNDQGIVWHPGKKEGNTVNVVYNLPIRFKLK